MLGLAVCLAACGTASTVGESVAVVGGDLVDAPLGQQTADARPDAAAADPTGPAATGPAAIDPTTPGAGIDPGTDPGIDPGTVPIEPVATDGGPGAALTTTTTAPATAPAAGPPCTVGAVPRRLALNAFYEKACVVNGLTVVASSQVDDAALLAAAEIVRGMLGPRPDLAAEMSRRRFRLGIIGVSERAVDLPEYRDLPINYPNTDWDAARAYGATPRRPLAAAPEENLLCTLEDTYPGQSVLTHELGHSVLDMAVLTRNPGFENRIKAAYKAAASLDVYQNSYAMTNADEYWAEGVQDYFDASRAGYGAGGGGDGYDSPIYSRETLRQNDPTLYALVAEVFPESDWRPSCPNELG